MVDPSPATHRVLLQHAQAREVLRVSRIRAPVPSTASTHRAVSVAIPDRWQSRLSIVRSDGEQPPHRARRGQHDIPG